jgi:hypothetical protein
MYCCSENRNWEVLGVTLQQKLQITGNEMYQRQEDEEGDRECRLSATFPNDVYLHFSRVNGYLVESYRPLVFIIHVVVRLREALTLHTASQTCELPVVHLWTTSTYMRKGAPRRFVCPRS